MAMAAISFGTSAGTPCEVPSQFATLAEALADGNCLIINLAEGRYPPQTVTRAVALNGAGPQSTLIVGTLLTPAITADGATAQLALADLRLEAGNGPEPVLSTINGGQITTASNIEVGRISPLFADGFEGTTP